MENSEKAVRQPQVIEWMERLGIALKRASDIQARLRDRLDTVLSHTPPTTAEDKAAPAESIVALANEIRAAVWELDRMSNGYDEMMELMEL